MLLWIGGLLLALLVFLALYGGLVHRTYDVASDKLDNADPIRLVVLSDLHCRTFGKDQQPLIDYVRGLEPDLICLVGDMIDQKMELEGVELLMKGIGGLAPCLYVTGNHEYWIDATIPKEKMSEWGAVVLENESAFMDIRGQRLYIYGVDDGDYLHARDYGALLAPAGRLPEDVYAILLAHRPDPMEAYAAYGFDLVLSGHSHGGIVRLPPLVNGLYTPDEGWFPRYVGGRYQRANTTMIVSRGLANDWPYVHIFNPPEVALVLLRGPDLSRM